MGHERGPTGATPFYATVTMQPTPRDIPYPGPATLTEKMAGSEGNLNSKA